MPEHPHAPQNHLCYLYHNDLQVLNNSLSFLNQNGLADETLFVWILPAALSRDKAITYLYRATNRMTYYLLKKQFLIYEPQLWYYHDPKKPFDPLFAMKMIEDTMAKAKKLKCSQVRFTGAPGAVSPANWEAMINYEIMVGNFLATYKNVWALCQHPRNAYNNEQLGLINSLHHKSYDTDATALITA